MLYGICFVLFGLSVYLYVQLKKFKEVHAIRSHIVFDAEKKAQHIVEKAKHEMELLRKDQENSLAMKELKCKQKEEKLDRERISYTEKLHEIERKEKMLKLKQKEADDLHAQVSEQLSRISRMNEQEAKQELMRTFEASLEHDMQLSLIQKMKEVEEISSAHAEKLIMTAMQRIAQKQIPEASLLYVALPDDDMKGKIIGKDGKNLRAFEAITGVTLVIDDAPKSLFISSFDPMRRMLAKQTLVDIISDGKIHPTRIEEAYQAASNRIEKDLTQHGIDAARRAKVPDLHPEIIRTLGKLFLRSSLGQNVLEHSVEVSHLMGLLAAELGLHEMHARRIGLLHDIGKALDAIFGASHAIAGYHFAIKHGEQEIIANGIGCHHNEMAPQTKEAALCAIADSLSAVRPHARIDHSHKHMQKQKDLEQIALQFEGVDRAFAMQSGRELRVFVLPELVDDGAAELLAKKLSKKIEESYSGHHVQITVIRETKAVKYSTN